MAKSKYTTKKMSSFLTKETAEKYEVVGLDGHSPKLVLPKYGSIDFRKMTVKSADQLVKTGFPYLKKKGFSSKAK